MPLRGGVSSLRVLRTVLRVRAARGAAKTGRKRLIPACGPPNTHENYFEDFSSSV